MPVALAIAATERSISAVRMTKVRPVAMIAGDRDLAQHVGEIVERQRRTGSPAKNDDQEQQRDERCDVAQLARAASRSSRGAPPWPRPSRCLMPASSSSCCGEQAVLADRLVREFARDRALAHDQDPVGQGQHGLGLGRDHDHADALVAQRRARSSPRPPWRRRPCRGSARPGPAPSAGGSAIAPAPPSAGCRPTACAAAGSTEAGRMRRRSTWPCAIRRSSAGLQQQAADALQDADRDVLVDRLVGEQHRAPALGHEGDAGPSGRGRCCASRTGRRRSRTCRHPASACRTAPWRARAGPSP